MRAIFLSITILLICSYIYATDVFGHISENTTWSPENNPYVVTHNVYVDAGVTLTILPGTVVKFHARPLTYDNSMSDYLIQGPYGDSNGKMLYVNGRVIAIGTEQDSITFTRYEETPDNMHWGNIFFSPQAPKSSFKHCIFTFAFQTQPSLFETYPGALCCYNGKIDVSYCRFQDNYISIWIENMPEPLLIEHNVFYQYHSVCNDWWPVGIEIYNDVYQNDRVIAYNRFYGYGSSIETQMTYPYPVTLLFNKKYNYGLTPQRGGTQTYRHNYEGDSFGNYVNSDGAGAGVGATCGNDSSKAYCRRNTLINCLGISAIGYVDVSDNLLIDSNKIYIYQNSQADVHHNILNNSVVTHMGAGRIYNNIVYNFGTWSAYTIDTGVSEVSNNVAYNGAGYPLNYDNWTATALIQNNIFLNVHALTFDPFDAATFRNNWMSIPLPAQCIDGGGNIIGTNPGFVDAANGDFHLTAASPCIDAGYTYPGYPLYDSGFFHRVVDGNDDGESAIDIGAYEYGSSFVGGFTGHVYLGDSTIPIPYVKIDIIGVTREYTDSLGWYRFNAPAGTYLIRAHHLLLGNRTFTITINEGEITSFDYHWDPRLPNGNEEPNAITPAMLQLRNYPNPFSQNTTISYILPIKGEVKLNIYNVKGQKVRELVNAVKQPDKYTVTWDGRDEKGNTVAPGIYFSRLVTAKGCMTTKMLMMR